MKDYYFPLDELKEGLVYEYKDVNNDSLRSLFTYYRTVETNGDKFLVGVQYDKDFQPAQLSREKLVSNGAKLVESFIYQNDSTGMSTQIPMEIEAGTTFPFEIKDSSSIFLYNVRWFDNPEDTTAFTRVIRNRRYVKDTLVQYYDKEIPAVVFSVRELIENYKEGYWEKELQGREVYAKGIGLFYFKKNITENFKLEYALEDRYLMSELEKKFATSISEE
ncbi:MAG: hypothetical protein R2784_19480 [Saprospiraceae bacterium]